MADGASILHRHQQLRRYAAFRKLGRAVRTRFLLRYLNHAALRANIQAAMNKSEQFFAFWSGSGLAVM